jgi:hypothetical protein
MTAALIDRVIEAQAVLIIALDNGAVDAIESATRQLSDALADVRTTGAWLACDATGDRVSHAMRQADAARTRVNYLADRTRQSLGRIAAARGMNAGQTYDARGKAGVSARWR